MARFLGALRKAKAENAISTFLDRRPGEQVRLDDPEGIRELLYELDKAEANEAANDLAERVACEMPLDRYAIRDNYDETDPWEGVTEILGWLQWTDRSYSA